MKMTVKEVLNGKLSELSDIDFHKMMFSLKKGNAYEQTKAFLVLLYFSDIKPVKALELTRFHVYKKGNNVYIIVPNDMDKIIKLDYDNPFTWLFWKYVDKIKSKFSVRSRER